MKDIPIKHINNQESNLTEDFKIRRIEDIIFENDLNEDLHRHDFFLFLFLSKGKGFHEIDFNNHVINDYSLYLIRPGQVHKLHIKKGSIGYIMQFKKDFLYSHNNISQNHLTKLIQHNIYNLEKEGIKKIETILNEVYKEYTLKAKGYQEVLKANLSIFLIELLRQRKNKPTTTASGTPYAQEKLEQFLELVESNSNTLKQVSQYVDLLNLSSYQLNSITKKLLDKTPSDIINDYIILEAKRQLLATSKQVSQIAYHLGYDDVSYFIRFFKKHTALSPESFRQNSK